MYLLTVYSFTTKCKISSCAGVVSFLKAFSSSCRQNKQCERVTVSGRLLICLLQGSQLRVHACILELHTAKPSSSGGLHCTCHCDEIHTTKPWLQCSEQLAYPNSFKYTTRMHTCTVFFIIHLCKNVAISCIYMYLTRALAGT